MNYLLTQEMNNNKILSFKRTLFKLELVDGPRCDRYKQASETSSHLLGDCDPLAVLGFRRVAHHFMKPRDFADFSVSKVLHFVRSAELLNAYAKGCTNFRNCRGIRVNAVPALMCSALFYLPIDSRLYNVNCE